jgi:HlyD family secretion protein
MSIWEWCQGQAPRLGEILDLREIDVRCELTLDQVERVNVGQIVEVRKIGHHDLFAIGRVVYVGIEVDTKTKFVPVNVRLTNPEQRLRSGEPVQLTFANSLSVTKRGGTGAFQKNVPGYFLPGCNPLRPRWLEETILRVVVPVRLLLAKIWSQIVSK